MNSRNPLHWYPVWKAESFPIKVDAAQLPIRADDGTETGVREIYRVVVGDADFAGAVAVVTAQASNRVLLVRQQRARLGRDLWELPRGMADAGETEPVETALRELHEEAGIRASQGLFVGFVYPDSGLLASEVAVVRIELESEPKDDEIDPSDGEVDDYRWLAVTELRGLIDSGELRDGLSLSALAVAGII